MNRMLPDPRKGRKILVFMVLAIAICLTLSLVLFTASLAIREGEAGLGTVLARAARETLNYWALGVLGGLVVMGIMVVRAFLRGRRRG